MGKECIRHTIDSLGMESPASDVSFKTMVAFTFDFTSSAATNTTSMTIVTPTTTVSTIWHQEAA